jgi:Autoinducer binding domain
MHGWAEGALREAVEVLARMGRNDLASDVNRIQAKIDFDNLEVLRCPGSDRIADGILEADSFAELATLLGRLAATLGFDHCTLHVISEGATTNFTTKVMTTYSDEWISRYVDRCYARIDPVSCACVTAQHGFFWDSLDQSAPTLRAFWEDSAAHGIGPSGYTLPIVTERGDKLAVSIASRLAAEVFRDRIERFESDLFSLGIFLADAFCRLASEDRPAGFNPTDDQISILRAIASGAHEAELRSRNYQQGSYATLERSICALFRTRTVAQAAVLAARIGVLADAPLARADILAVSVAGDASPAAAAAGTLPKRRLARMRTAIADAPSKRLPSSS